MIVVGWRQQQLNRSKGMERGRRRLIGQYQRLLPTRKHSTMDHHISIRRQKMPRYSLQYFIGVCRVPFYIYSSIAAVIMICRRSGRGGGNCVTYSTSTSTWKCYTVSFLSPATKTRHKFSTGDDSNDLFPFLGFGHVAYRCISAALDFVSSICLYKCCGQEKKNHGGAAIEAQTWVTQFHSHAVTSFVRPFPLLAFFQCRRPLRHLTVRGRRFTLFCYFRDH